MHHGLTLQCCGPRTDATKTCSSHRARDKNPFLATAAFILAQYQTERHKYRRLNVLLSTHLKRVCKLSNCKENKMMQFSVKQCHCTSDST